MEQQIVENLSKTDRYMPDEKIKKSFFLQLRDLCYKYGVTLYPGMTEYKYNDSDDYEQYAQVINFEFYNGQTYVSVDGIISTQNSNRFRNISNYRDMISVNPRIDIYALNKSFRNIDIKIKDISKGQDKK